MRKPQAGAALREREAPLDGLGVGLVGQQSRPPHRRDCTKAPNSQLHFHLYIEGEDTETDILQSVSHPVGGRQ